MTAIDDRADDLLVHKKRNWIATVATLIVLGGLIWFVSRIFFFTHLIQTGQFNPEQFDFSKTYTSIAKLAAQPAADGAFNVVTKNNPSLGVEGAPITIVEFADFTCPYSRQASYTMRAFAAEHPDQIHYIYRDFPIMELNPIAGKVAEAARCAQDQGKFWEYHDKLYQNQSDLDEQSLLQFANELGLKTNLFTSCLTSNKHAEGVAIDYRAGFDAGVRGTPTFFINGNRIPGAIPKEVLEKILVTLTPNK